MEREKAEREMEREAEEKRKRKEQMIRQKKMLEAAFDGENDVIHSLIKEVIMCMCQYNKWIYSSPSIIGPLIQALGYICMNNFFCAHS